MNPQESADLSKTVEEIAIKNAVSDYLGVLFFVARDAIRLAVDQTASAEQMRDVTLGAVRAKVAKLLQDRAERALTPEREELRRSVAAKAGAGRYLRSSGRAVDGSLCDQFREGSAKRRGGPKPHREG